MMRSNAAIVWILTVIALCGASPATAEVAAILSNTAGPSVQASPIVIAPIVDDPDPMGQSWIRYNGDSGNRRVLNDGGFANGDGRPSVTVDSLGVPTVVWAKNSASGYDVVLARFVNGAWSQEITVADSPYDERDPFIVLSPVDGSLHLFYWVHDASPRVMYRWSPSDLSGWSAELQVSQIGDVAIRPTAVFHDGVLIVAFESHGPTLGSTPRQIVVATYDGSTFSSEVLTTSLHQDPNWPEIHSRGGSKLWVDWVDDDGLMSWRRTAQSGSWDPVESEPFESTEQRDYLVRGGIRVEVITGVGSP